MQGEKARNTIVRRNLFRDVRKRSGIAN